MRMASSQFSVSSQFLVVLRKALLANEWGTPLPPLFFAKVFKIKDMLIKYS